MKESLDIEIRKTDSGLIIDVSSDEDGESCSWQITKRTISCRMETLAIKQSAYPEVYNVAYNSVVSHIEKILRAALASVQEEAR